MEPTVVGMLGPQDSSPHLQCLAVERLSLRIFVLRVVGVGQIAHGTQRVEHHVKILVSVDFFTVPTIRFQVLFVFLVLAHERRRILHFGVTAHPTAEWTAQQLRDAFPWDTAPCYLLRDRDRIFGDEFTKQVKDMGIQQVLSAPRSPWQRAYIERMIGTLRRECLDHLIVFHEASLYRHVQRSLAYYHESRTHLSLAKDTPEPRPVHPAERGAVVAIPQVGGLHHRYERRAA